MQTPVESNGWRIEHAEFVVVRDSLKPLIGRNLFEALDISINETVNSFVGKTINKFKKTNAQCPFKTRLAKGIQKNFFTFGTI